jgi:xylulokinase
VAYSGRWAFEALAQSAGGMPAMISLGGGGARSDFWCQLKADVLGVPLQRASVPDAAAMGAAILAGVGAGVMPSLEAAVRGLVSYDRVFEPEAAVAGYHDEKFGQYQALYAALRPFNARY